MKVIVDVWTPKEVVMVSGSMSRILRFFCTGTDTCICSMYQKEHEGKMKQKFDISPLLLTRVESLSYPFKSLFYIHFINRLKDCIKYTNYHSSPNVWTKSLLIKNLNLRINLVQLYWLKLKFNWNWCEDRIKSKNPKTIRTLNKNVIL